MLPPPRLPTVTSAPPRSPTDWQGAWYGGRARLRRGAAGACALLLKAGGGGGDTYPGGEEHGAERRGPAGQAPSITLQTGKEINQKSQVSPPFVNHQ